MVAKQSKCFCIFHFEYKSDVPRGVPQRSDMYVHVVNDHGKHVVRLVNVDFAVTNRAELTFSNIINGSYYALF